MFFNKIYDKRQEQYEYKNTFFTENASTDKLIVSTPNYCLLETKKKKMHSTDFFKMTISFGDTSIYKLKWNTLYMQ